MHTPLRRLCSPRSTYWHAGSPQLLAHLQLTEALVFAISPYYYTGSSKLAPSTKYVKNTNSSHQCCLPFFLATTRGATEDPYRPYIHFSLQQCSPRTMQLLILWTPEAWINETSCHPDLESPHDLARLDLVLQYTAGFPHLRCRAFFTEVSPDWSLEEVTASSNVQTLPQGCRDHEESGKYDITKGTQ